MELKQIVWNVPDTLYQELVQAQHELEYPNLADFVGQAVQRRLSDIKTEAWQRKFKQFQKQFHAAGGFGLGETKDEVISNLRKIREQVFEEEYADLYRQ